jgi:hypothetical protein
MAAWHSLLQAFNQKGKIAMGGADRAHKDLTLFVPHFSTDNMLLPLDLCSDPARTLLPFWACTLSCHHLTCAAPLMCCWLERLADRLQAELACYIFDKGTYTGCCCCCSLSRRRSWCAAAPHSQPAQRTPTLSQIIDVKCSAYTLSPSRQASTRRCSQDTACMRASPKRGMSRTRT